MEIAVAVRRLRQYINDKPRGRSQSATGFSVAITGLTTPQFKITIGSSAQQNISIANTYTTGAQIAKALQDAIRAALPTDNNFAFATVSYGATYGFTILSGLIGTENTVVVEEGATDDLAAVLKLGTVNEGTEDYYPPARYTDEDLETFISSAFEMYNGSVDGGNKVYIDSISDGHLTIILYYAWIMALETDAGSAVYTYNQQLGEDVLDLTAVFRNIMQLLAYLREQVATMKDQLGISSLFVSSLTRYDRELDARMPEYVKSPMPRPRFLQLARVSATVALVEWQETYLRDFQCVQLYTSSAQGILDLSLLTMSDRSSENGVVETATKQMELANATNTVHKVTGLSGVVYFLLTFRDTRGHYYYSDEYSLDLNNPSAVAVKVVDNTPRS